MQFASILSADRLNVTSCQASTSLSNGIADVYVRGVRTTSNVYVTAQGIASTSFSPIAVSSCVIFFSSFLRVLYFFYY